MNSQTMAAFMGTMKDLLLVNVVVRSMQKFNIVFVWYRQAPSKINSPLQPSQYSAALKAQKVIPPATITDPLSGVHQLPVLVSDSVAQLDALTFTIASITLWQLGREPIAIISPILESQRSCRLGEVAAAGETAASAPLKVS